MGTSFYFVAWSLSFIIGILAKDYKAFQDGRYRKILLCGQLRPLAMSQQYGRRVGLEARDGLGFPRLAHHIHSLQPNQPVFKNNKKRRKTLTSIFPLTRERRRSHLSDANRHREGSQLLVKGHQHARLHGRHQAVQDVMRLPQNYCGRHRGEHEKRARRRRFNLFKKGERERARRGKGAHCF